MSKQVESPRQQVLRVLKRVVLKGRSLDAALAKVPSKHSAYVQAMTYGVLREYYFLSAVLISLLRHPFKAADKDIELLLLLGLFQLQSENAPNYAVVSEIVNEAEALGKSWAKAVVNGVLRNYLRNEEQLLGTLTKASLSARYAAPNWIIEKLQSDWPEYHQQILEANRIQAPMFLRVNQLKGSTASYRALLADQCEISAETVKGTATALRLLQPCEVSQLPEFNDGRVSVQDAAAQWSAVLLDPQPQDRLLDACAAPGGKTLHLLEQQPELAALHAVEINTDRAKLIQQNLQRAKNRATVTQLHVADLRDTNAWWDGSQFQRILLDAPCTGSGVIRRHPDIQLLRRPGDVDDLVELQKAMLDSVWPLLAPGGLLLYCTCSVFKVENDQQIAAFVERARGAEVQKIAIPDAVQCEFGVQVLTGSQQRDGFYYALLQKMLS